jgi:hypothetical protein
VTARYKGVCRGCGAYTQPRNGKGYASGYCKACHPGAIAPRWTRPRVRRRDARVAHPLRPATGLRRKQPDLIPTGARVPRTAAPGRPRSISLSARRLVGWGMAPPARLLAWSSRRTAAGRYGYSGMRPGRDSHLRWLRSSISIIRRTRSLVTTAVSELDGSSGTAGYGPLYNHNSDGQHIAFVYLQKWLGVSHPLDTAKDFVLAPLSSITGQPALSSAISAYQGASSKDQTAWTDA